MGILSDLRLRSYRNYTKLDASFGPGVTLLLGANGQGKTNLLEAICYLALLRSFRLRRIQPLRQWEADGFFIGGTLKSSKPPWRSCELSVRYGERRQMTISGAAVDRASAFINQFVCVPLIPEDIQLVKGAAGGRRRFLDIALSQVDPMYLAHLQAYVAVLRSRNAALRDPRRFPRQVQSGYERMLCTHGRYLWSRRLEFTAAMNEVLAEQSARLLGPEAPDYSLRLVSSGLLGDGSTEPVRAPTEEEYGAALERSRARDLADGGTQQGPHRDEVVVALGGRSLALYGSEGQCRLGALALRLASLAILKRDLTGVKPVILLVDDVMGELDGARRARLAEALQDADQTFVAATAYPPELRGCTAAVLTVVGGALTKG